MNFQIHAALGVAIVAMVFAFESTRAQGLVEYNNPTQEIRSTVTETALSTWRTFGESVVYEDLNDIDFSKLNTIYPKPVSLGIRACLKPVIVRNTDKLTAQIIAAANGMGIDKSKLMVLNPKEAIAHSIQIAAAFLELYENNDDPIDHDAQWSSIPPNRMPFYTRGIDDIIERGRGDCDDYEAATIAVFRYMQTINPRLANIHVTGRNPGGRMHAHAYNSFIIIFDDKIVVTMLDAWAYDHNSSMLCTRGNQRFKGVHVDEEPYRFRADFYSDIFDQEGYAASLDALLKTDQLPKDRKLAMLERLAIASKNRDLSTFVKIHDQYFQERMDDLSLPRATKMEIDFFESWYLIKDTHPIAARSLAEKILKMYKSEADLDKIYSIFPDLKK